MAAQVEGSTGNPTVLDWVRQRAHDDAQMQLAAAAGMAAPGAPDDPDGDVVTVLTRDHDQLTSLVEQLSAIPGHRAGGSRAQIGRRESTVGMIADVLARHVAAEEKLLRPVVRAVGPDGEDRAGQGLAQAQEAVATLAALGRAHADSDEFDDLVEKLALDVRRHVAAEARLFLQLPASPADGKGGG